MVSSPGMDDHRFFSKIRGTISWAWSAVTTYEKEEGGIKKKSFNQINMFEETSYILKCV